MGWDSRGGVSICFPYLGSSMFDAAESVEVERREDSAVWPVEEGMYGCLEAVDEGGR